MKMVDITYDEKNAYKIFKNMINSGFMIKQLIDLYNTYPQNIIHILLKYCDNNLGILRAIKDYYNSNKIEGNKFLVISDTHIGRLSYDENNDFEKQWLKNETGLYNAYKYADINNIKTIVHAGDLIEGASDPYSKKINYIEQFQYINKFYPFLPNIKTYLLLGNHDYNLMYYNKVRLKEKIKDIKQLELIGVNYSYVSLNNELIKISHDCSVSEFYQNIELTHNFELSGHSHVYTMLEEERKIKVPALSCVDSDSTYRGFLEITEEENEYVFRHYGENMKLKSEKVLSKKVNKML